MFLDAQIQRLPAAIDHFPSIKLKVAAWQRSRRFLWWQFIFPFSWSWQWPWSWRACRACFPLPYLSSSLICVITALHLSASQLPSALQRERWTERLSKEYGLLHHIIPSQRGHLKVVMLLIKTLPPCSLVHLWSLKSVGWAVTLQYLQHSDTHSPQCGPSQWQKKQPVLYLLSSFSHGHCVLQKDNRACRN